MNLTAKLTALTLCMGLAGQVLATELKHWPADQARQLDAMIAANANKGNFAVFDMDNTSYRNDLEEALLPFMENKGLITRESMDAFSVRSHQRDASVRLATPSTRYML